MDVGTVLQFAVETATGLLGVYLIPVLGVRMCARWFWRLRI